ncbi:hypothetical protein [Cupriavidus metallidurans]|uniref:Uncharacterized protein n=1 Tax=Cupriavidus metallidurans (strain ATCC 43123 / DSM 2839 / NBRC 102507 / CH34) TaxID=266264 RepID=Q1LLU2_CUPMC|nr:hypothetical protein [Cupriavidus metallidurans]ABF08884.1 hypothetical protein Rmet_2005 [Cupriavidus metallidurans CH34]QGS30214.1 hypothetical protein FOB83_15695 [Cupriavidus metallidurans]
MVDDLLARLYRVREAGYSQWLACCPACQEPGRTLLIRSNSDGFTLIHCRNGCPPGFVLHAAGVPWSVLFSDGAQRRHAWPPEWWREPPRYEREPRPMVEQ